MRTARSTSRLSTFAFRAAALGLALAVLALPVSASARPHRKHQAREEILALEAAWRTAMINDDMPAMDKLLSDDYIGITTHGDVLTKAQQLERLKSRQGDITHFDATDTKIKLVGQVAIVTALASVQGTNDHQAFTGEYRYTRIYQHLPSGVWKITNFEITPVHPRSAAG